MLINSSLNTQKQNSQNFGMSKKLCTDATTDAIKKVREILERMPHLHMEETQLVRFHPSELEYIEKIVPDMEAEAKAQGVELHLNATEDGKLDRKNYNPTPTTPSQSSSPPVPITSPAQQPQAVFIINKTGNTIKNVLTSIVSFTWGHKILSTIGGLLLSANVHNYHLAKSGEKLNAAIIQKHGLTEVLEKCKANPEDFYSSAQTKSTRDPDDVKRCPRLIIDRLAAKKAGREIQELRARDAGQKRLEPRYGYELGAFMGEEYKTALNEVREGNPEQNAFIFLYHNDAHEQSISDTHRAWYPSMGPRIYRGEDIDKVVDSEMGLDLKFDY